MTFRIFSSDLDDDAGTDTEGIEEDPPSYHSGRVRIIGAEPAGDTVREVTGPVVEDHPELPHWNDAPTGQVPAILDTSTGDEQTVAPPMWREEETDWEAQEEVFEPSMLSDDLPAVGALLGEQGEDIDVERQPWHFESDDTLVIPPEPGFGAEPGFGPSRPWGPSPRPSPPTSPSRSGSRSTSPSTSRCRSPTTSRSTNWGTGCRGRPSRLPPAPRPPPPRA